MRHPGEKELALYSSHDLDWMNNIRVRWHVNSCSQCAEDVSAFESVGSATRSGVDQLPAGLRWDRLAAEMTANIHLGLEAGECVGPAPVNKPDRMGWRAALVMASMTMILLAAWWLNPPRGREVAMHRSRCRNSDSSRGNRSQRKRLCSDPAAYARSTDPDHCEHAGITARPVCGCGHGSGHDQQCLFGLASYSCCWVRSAWGQTQKLDPRSTMHITFPEDSPVTVVSADWGESNASARGGAMLLDLHTSLSLRNSGSRRIRGITLLVSAQDVTPGGKASVSVPSLNAGPGDNFPIRIDLRLLRPLQAGNGPLVEIGLDGILFDDLIVLRPESAEFQTVNDRLGDRSPP